MLTDAHTQDLLTISQVAARLQVHEQSVRRMVRDGRLTAVQLGGPRTPVRIPAETLESFIYSSPEETRP